MGDQIRPEYAPSTLLLMFGAAALLSSGAYGRAISYLTENPIPTWAALSVIFPVMFFGFLAIAKGNLDDEIEEQSNQKSLLSLEIKRCPDRHSEEQT